MDSDQNALREQVFVDHRATLRRWWIGLCAAGLIGLLLLGLLAVRTFGSTSPEAAVRDYFTALADRDFTAAMAVVAPEVVSGQEELVDQVVLASPDYQPPTGLDVQKATIDDQTATVPVSYQVDGREFTSQLRLRRGDGWGAQLRPQWLLVDALGSLILTQAPERIVVNGQSVAGFDSRGLRTLPALPGGYQVAVSEEELWWEARTVSVAVAAQAGTEVEVPAVPSQAARDELTRQVHRRLDRCTGDSAEDCPFRERVRIPTNAEDVQWEITRYPRLRITGTVESGELVLWVETSQPGELAVTGRFSTGTGGFEAAVSITISGFARASGETLVFQSDQ